MKILIIEDEKVTQDLIQLILKDYPCEICVAGSFAEGLLQKAQFEPDIILLDCKLPDSDEKTLKRNISSLKQDCAIILLTGYLTEEHFIEAKEAGVETVFHKDILTRSDLFISELTKIWYSFKIQGKTSKEKKNSTQSLALKRADIPQSEILLVLHEQNLNQEKTNAKLFQKLDEVSEKAAENQLVMVQFKAETVGGLKDINLKFTDLNGSVARTIKKVSEMDAIQQADIVEASKKKIIKDYYENKKFEISTKAKWILGVVVGLFSLIAAIIESWPFLVWVWHLCFH